MGGCQSYSHQYSVPISQPQQNESAIYKKPGYENKKPLEYPSNNSLTIQDSFLKTVEKYPNKNALGTKKDDQTYVYKTYSEVKDLATYIGSGIINLNLIPRVVKYQDREGHQIDLKMIGIHAKNREEWVTLDMANSLYGNSMVPLYDTLGPDTIGYVIKHSGISTCFCQASTIVQLLQSKELGQLQTIVTLDKIDQKEQIEAQKRGLRLITMQEVINAGKNSPKKYIKVSPNHCFTLSYTSGTTGNPKGAMVSHKNFMSATAAGEISDLRFSNEDVYLSYLPLPHIYERLMMIQVIHYGATACFYNGDILKIKEDLAACRPTIFCSVPRLYNKFYQGINAKFQEAQGVQAGILSMGLSTKMSNVQSGAGYTHKLWDGIVFKKTKEILGGRCRAMVSGSAPLSEDVINFMKVAMVCPLLQGYGLTESTAAGFITQQDDNVAGHVGGPTANVEFKLVDVKDMNYTSKDVNDKGELTPRGEILFRGPIIFQGYYLDPQKTHEAVDKDGWLHTGDIGMINPNGSLKIIDRKKNIFKLQQGEYVAPEKVENIYVRAKGVEQVYLHGDSFQNYCIAVIFPNKDVFMAIAQENKIQGTFEELCQNPQMNKIMLKNITTLGKNEGLHGFEQAKKLILIPQTFLEINCMTNTMKLQRQQAKTYFKDQLDKLYKEPL